MAITINGKSPIPPGPPGLSPYQVAVAGGYTGTEEDFNAALAGLRDLAPQVDAHTEAIGNMVSISGGGTIQPAESLGAGPWTITVDEDPAGIPIEANDVSYSNPYNIDYGAYVSGALNNYAMELGYAYTASGKLEYGKKIVPMLFEGTPFNLFLYPQKPSFYGPFRVEARSIVRIECLTFSFQPQVPMTFELYRQDDNTLLSSFNANKAVNYRELLFTFSNQSEGFWAYLKVQETTGGDA